ncbi:hypothetical protein A0J61_11573 [Choanephora cucurbitarum]|uniref:Uncharacterized protein n=1 Tax=Choanephora cucurbitarum TaxID=101091 RepID=A0A1C7MUB0_9FUNG|nr:hypothetical protein A0J61_11573 [Choanephora cucurbitarum]
MLHMFLKEKHHTAKAKSRVQALLQFPLQPAIDWFGPYKTTYNVGCIYLTIQNLGKADGRDQKENMLFVGAIPGPQEPPTTAMNHYLEPLVNDLLVLMKGVEMKMVMNDGSFQVNKVKVCLGTLSSNQPATK